MSKRRSLEERRRRTKVSRGAGEEGGRREEGRGAGGASAQNSPFLLLLEASVHSLAEVLLGRLERDGVAHDVLRSRAKKAREKVSSGRGKGETGAEPPSVTSSLSPGKHPS